MGYEAGPANEDETFAKGLSQVLGAGLDWRADEATQGITRRSTATPTQEDWVCIQVGEAPSLLRPKSLKAHRLMKWERLGFHFASATY